MRKKLADYLDAHASNMLHDEPFLNWSFERSVENDLEEPIVQYVFPGHSMDLRCDGDEKIDVIFLSEERHDLQDGNLFEVPFTWSRDQVLSHFGPPEKSGPKVMDPILGNYGVQLRKDRETAQNTTRRLARCWIIQDRAVSCQ